MLRTLFFTTVLLMFAMVAQAAPGSTGSSRHEYCSDGTCVAVITNWRIDSNGTYTVVSTETYSYPDPNSTEQPPLTE